MAWQVSNLVLLDLYYRQHLSPKEIGDKFRGNPMPEECVLDLLKWAVGD